MSQITLKGNPINTLNSLPAVGENAPNFELVGVGLDKVRKDDFAGRNVVLNIFPSVDTGTCAASVRKFNELAADAGAQIICISRDLPFAQGRFCGAEGIENVVMGSDFATGKFGRDYGVVMIDGPLAQLHSRAIIVINEEGKVVHTEQVAELVDEPNYTAALEAIK